MGTCCTAHRSSWPHGTHRGVCKFLPKCMYPIHCGSNNIFSSSLPASKTFANPAASRQSRSPDSAFANRADAPRTCRWFGLILLPIVSFSGDGIVAVGNFSRNSYKHLRRALRRRHTDLIPPTPNTDTLDEDLEPFSSEFAHGRPIDLSIQFTLWWTPFLVLLGWWTDRPMHLLFGACFWRIRERCRHLTLHFVQITLKLRCFLERASL